MKTDFGGLPIAFHLTRGDASDSRNFETLLDIGPDINPRAALGDKGYDSKSNREAARQRGICPAIPYRSNTKDIPVFFPKVLYKGRARIEQAVGKRFKRIALRCEKTAQNYGSFVALALGFILIKSVHTEGLVRADDADGADANVGALYWATDYRALVVTLATQPEPMRWIRAKASPMRLGTTSSQG